ncbi:MAG: sensor histidine kinase, partial [Betaproteobacteria bacterium]|nr:sensor histidine kinase [Betaproteobacteria bacterium]
ADDYIIKSRLKRLAPALRRSLQAANHRRERALAEQQLRVSETKLHELASHLELAKEEERAAIAREIHDDIGGTLTALKFDLAWLKRNTQLEGPVAARLAAAVKLAEEAALATQRMVRDLRPPVLNDGIAPALEWLTREFTQRSGIPLRFEVNREDIPIEEPTCIATYRICQEALTNVLKHARASKVDVSLFIAEDSLHLEVTDNGCGSTPADRAKSRSFGITSMRERARSLNGTLDISSPPGKGTTIMLSLPLPTISPNKETL